MQILCLFGEGNDLLHALVLQIGPGNANVRIRLLEEQVTGLVDKQSLSFSVQPRFSINSLPPDFPACYWVPIVFVLCMTAPVWKAMITSQTGYFVMRYRGDGL